MMRFSGNSNTDNGKKFLLTFLLVILIPFVAGSSAAMAIPALPTVNILGEKFYYYAPAKSESLYSISKKFGFDYNTLIKWNQGLQNNVAKGQKVFYPAGSEEKIKEEPKPENELKYTVRYGDTLFSLARTFNTTVHDILVMNPELTLENLRAGSIINILENTGNRNLREETYTKQVVTAFTSENVKKGSSWYSLGKTYGVDEGLLQECNPKVTLKKNAYVAIPVIENVSCTRMVVDRDPREDTAAGIQEIYDEYHESLRPKEVNVCILLSAPKTKKDVDFSRGFLTALSGKKPATKLNLSFAEYNSEASLSNENVRNADIIVATFEKDLPHAVAALAHDKEVINVFDLKDDSFNRIKGMVNLLQGSEQFNNNIVEGIMELFGDAQFFFLGNPLNADDAIANELMNRLSSERFEYGENLDEAIAPYSGNFIIYCLASKKDDIRESLKMISKFKEEYPDVSGLQVMGRPNWIVYMDQLKNEMQALNTYFPSRFYFNEDSSQASQFKNKYKELFKAEPVVSYPIFAVMGYDTANLIMSDLMPTDSNIPESLQIDFRMQQFPGGGKVNTTAYFINTPPFGNTEVIRIEGGNND